MLTFTEELVLLLNDEDGAPLPIRQDVARVRSQAPC